MGVMVCMCACVHIQNVYISLYACIGGGRCTMVFTTAMFTVVCYSS